MKIRSLLVASLAFAAFSLAAFAADEAKPAKECPKAAACTKCEKCKEGADCAACAKCKAENKDAAKCEQAGAGCCQKPAGEKKECPMAGAADDKPACCKKK